MTIILNGEPRAVAAATLEAALAELGYGGAHVATAVNGDFVPRDARAGVALREGDRLEVLAPLQGG
ncbi:sulfur carrier protein ThiS [Limibaculum sp. FT325]|uniref:sulfur carrier protein ThiS n=1 Tax=Thermohalobaculum sediminis TaxID=2939436 RepID=UPI0020BDAABC|nr:sulfur carrier protein ThiS [Limibaculum sediminis]MCL5776004.1 sulfur carrier protein ThiS [Limibaculum sediminis]